MYTPKMAKVRITTKTRKMEQETEIFRRVFVRMWYTITHRASIVHQTSPNCPPTIPQNWIKVGIAHLATIEYRSELKQDTPGCQGP